MNSVNVHESSGNGPLCIIDFANYPFIRRFASHLNETQGCAYLYHPGFQSPNQSQRGQHSWEYPVKSGADFAKNNLVKRWFQERAWARSAASLLTSLRPAAVIVTNAPLEVVRIIQSWCHEHRVPFVFWLQDVHSYAIAEALRGKVPVLGGAVASYYRTLERRLLRESQRVLLIADDHRQVLDDFGVPQEMARIFPNWSTIEDFPCVRSSAEGGEAELEWRAQHGLIGKRLVMYSGTLGLKHDPGLLADLAEAFSGDPSIEIVVISSGPGADWLRAHASDRKVENLRVVPFVDYSMISVTLQSAEVLIAILEPAAARFSVPSKILTYACAGRPVVVAMPLDNAAARLIQQVGFGLATRPGDNTAFIDAVRSLLDNPSGAEILGQRGREYAEQSFPMVVIEGRFMAALAGLVP